MEGNRWYYSREQLQQSPSRRAGLDPDKELGYRQQAANLLQDMGQRLNVSQLTINTAIVYMHRFFMVQSFTRFHRNSVAPAALFLAAKVEEQPRKLEHVIKVAHACLTPQDPPPDTRSEAYLLQAQDLVILESIILQTLGFEITIDHPHTHVVKCTQLVRASKDLAQTSYFMATNSLHLTTFSLQYTPPVVACVCIHLACKWSNWEIPVSTDGKPWWEYVDVTVTLELLDELTHEFLQILEKTPNRLKRIRNWRASQAAKKPKAEQTAEDEEDDGGLSEQAIYSILSRSSSDSTTAGLMTMSSTTMGLQSSFPVADPASSNSGASLQQTWPHKQDPLTVSSQSQPPDGVPGAPLKQSTKSLPSSKVSLKEYRAKHAEELAAQKRQLENMGASVKEQYAHAAQSLLVQQQQQREHQAQPSAIILKLPVAEKPERQPVERPDKSMLKARVPPAVTLGGKTQSKSEELKLCIKVPVSERHSSSDESKSKDKHKSSSSNHHHHHHHHNHHSHKHGHNPSAGGNSKRSGDSKHGSQHSSSSHKSSGSSSSSRKRPYPEDGTSNELPSKSSKGSKSSSGAFPSSGTAHGNCADPVSLTVHQASYRARSSHGRADRGHQGANGHNTGQPIAYQDTVNMLHSLLSAQGVQPTQPPAFPFAPKLGEHRSTRPAIASRPGNTDKLRPPPLPADPPPSLPPLPK
ncbi:cyclin-T1 [Ambystoma mexicanum]|uniref:cyclin-T1 n=1 Tax=Ambystoma mexicanum TaxID=8296 RepID=UPI0037E914ED